MCLRTTLDKCNGAQRVVAKNGVLRVNQHEHAIGLAPQVLTGLGFQIPVKAFNAATKTGAIMIGAERFDLQVGRTFRRHLPADPSLLLSHRLDESLVQFGRVLQRSKKHCAGSTSSRTTAPGWSGAVWDRTSSSSVIILKIYIDSVVPFEAKADAPVASHRHRHRARPFAIPDQAVRFVARNVHLLRLRFWR